MNELSSAPIHRIIKKAGASRVSEDAAERLREILERVGEEISKKALEFSQYAGRRTIKREDIDMAAKTVLKAFFEA